MHLIVLAAGEGKRMGNPKFPKVFYPIADWPMLGHVIQVIQDVQAIKVDSLTCVVSPKNIEKVRSFISTAYPQLKCFYCVQDEQLGTGHAVTCAYNFLKQHFTAIGDRENILVLLGDVPLIDEDILQDMGESTADVLSVAMKLSNTKGYGHLLLDSHKRVLSIIEDKDIQDKHIDSLSPYVHSGLFAFKWKALQKLLPKLHSNNVQKEYYLTQLVQDAYEDHFITGFIEADYKKVMGINTLKQLAEAEYQWQCNKRQKIMDNGVHLVHPDSIHFAFDTQVGIGSFIDPYVVFKKHVSIGQGVNIYSHCVLEHCIIGDECTIGPYAHILEHTSMDNKNVIGNFVEIKRTTLGKSNKVKHLTYMGDAEVESYVNVGAGTVFSNFDGIKKHKTIIEDDVFIGSNSTLVAPVTIHKHSFVGAATLLRKDVRTHSLAINKKQEEHKMDWVLKKKNQLSKDK